ncbi:hypothetical protein GUJ93_ZPchr0007g5813 [Zizania palustris]|uniref:ubiquitinyl hydrolase 1 n=1 Tax=Zizania palustris TaxID=103762 RepID=A0A8J5ST74_ZIZPA|nr:hypothetical protein GUJ93_ZPchr0007g5813 [Zizania palustris]
MSGGDEIVLFGSFTEAETKLFHGQPLTSPTKSADKTWELPEIQFGSLNFSVLSLQKTSNSVTQGASNSVTQGPIYPAKSINGQSKIITKENACDSKKEIVVCTLPNGSPVLFNGSPTNNANVSLNNGAVENIKKSGSALPSGVPVKNVSSLAPPAVPEVDHDGIECIKSSSLVVEITENGTTAVDPPIEAPVDEAVPSLSKKAFQNSSLLPHGLKNTGNICFLNASLQALLSCLPFVQLLQDLRNRNIPKVGYPTLSAFVEFISQFDVLDDSNMKKDDKFSTISAKSLNPAMFDIVLRNFTPDVPAGTSARPRQEDAQEFLSFAMDRMHDELVKLNGNGSNSKEGMVVSSTDDDDAWETVGRKNKSAIMRTQSFVPSELTAIFGGQLQSSVKATGNKASVTIQPFRLLHLDIFPDAVQTLDDALHLFSAPESLEGYRTAAGKAGLVTARKLVKIHALSKIMILHLKRFSYGNYGCTKLFKALHFPLELVLSRDLLSSPSSEVIICQIRFYEFLSKISLYLSLGRVYAGFIPTLWNHNCFLKLNML